MKIIDEIIEECVEKLYPELSLGSWVAIQKKVIIRQALTDYKKEIDERINKQISIHKQLESECVGDIKDLMRGIKSENPHTFVIENLERMKDLLNKI